MPNSEPELSHDIMPDGRERFYSCDKCNYDMHDCPGCGEPLTHNGLERGPAGTYRIHAGCTD